ncbi:Tn3 family transposase [Idiomarina sp.]|uniref:Tn3 family transposase n=1 Tax=Idiomarina sp. TaxID=1874361 RepID=UPI003A90B9ED
MSRIGDIYELSLFRPNKTCYYEHIDQLFAGSIDFVLIEQLLPGMLKIILSIKLGRTPASSLLRQLGTYSRKNKLYFTFRELGKVIRTLFLLNYFNNADLRQAIQSETSKSEEFNGFIKWLLFGGKGVVVQNVRHEQSTIIC